MDDFVHRPGAEPYLAYSDAKPPLRPLVDNESPVNDGGPAVSQQLRELNQNIQPG
jgi:hypothetical protein